MAKRMLIDAVHPEETRVVIADDKQIYDFDFASASKKQLKGNIYLAKITRVEPSLQAAFVEYGGNKQGFLPFSEIHPDYYQIPMSDRKRLMEEVEGEDDSNDQPEESKSSEPSEQQASGSEEQHAEEQPAMPAGEEQEHPAYLREGAIDVSTSEEVEPSEHDNTPISEIPVSETSEISAETTAPNNEPAVSGEILTPQSSDAPQGEEAQPAQEVETLANEEEEVSSQRKKRSFMRRYKIQEVIRRGQVVLVQVIKEERGNKGVSLTTYLSLAGRYCVLMPNSPKDGGISRKIASPEDRKRLKAISTELRLAKGMSVIIRTAGMERTRAEIKRDYDYLVKVWNGIREGTLQSNAPALIYEESDLIKRSIRDQYSGDIEDVIVEGDEGYKAAKEFMKLLLPSHTPKIKHYKEQTPLFYAYNIEDQLLSMHDPVVKLRSGGYIVINPTEALISIDVNSGRSTGERNIEETATKTNLEAAAEISRQLRLRDLAGLIVIDFIDMLESRNRRAVEKTLKDSLKLDRAKIQLGRISPFGLLEMSRQRLRPSISETNMVQCSHCVGRGYIRSNESMSIQMIRALEKEASSGTWSGFRLLAPQAIALHMLNTKRDILRAIEQRYSISIQVLIDPALSTSEFNLEKMRRSQSGGGENRDRDRDRDRQRRNERNDRNERDRNESRPAPVAAEPQESDESADITSVDTSHETEEAGASMHASNDNRDGRRPRRRRGRRGGARHRNREDRQSNQQPMNNDNAPVSDQQSYAADDAQPQENAAPSTGEGEGSSRPPRGNRGGRGRRRWRGERGEQGDRGPRRERNDHEHAPRDNHEPTRSDGRALPAFATETPVQPEPPRREPEKVAVGAMESTPRDPNAPSKKGWWQKMIDLDE